MSKNYFLCIIVNVIYMKEVIINSIFSVAAKATMGQYRYL